MVTSSLNSFIHNCHFDVIAVIDYDGIFLIYYYKHIKYQIKLSLLFFVQNIPPNKIIKSWNINKTDYVLRIKDTQRQGGQ